MTRYNPSVVEPKWQQYWEQNATFATPRLPVGEKLYVLDMFPYPSGNGLHVGHPEGQTATDIVCRYARMHGKCVLHPMGWDAFGLPAEQYAKKTGTPPRITTEKNIGTFRGQEKMLGFSYDWSRELSTTDVDYFRWTQWIFLVLFDTWFDTQTGKGRPIAELPIPPDVAAAGDEAVRRFQDAHRLAYQSHAPVNWCPELGTVLANEEVIGGLSERGSYPVVRIPLRQWMLRITAYADRLENDLDALDWPDSIKALQRNWIGRSTGAEVDFFIGATSAPNGKPNPQEFKAWRNGRAASGLPTVPGDDVLRVFTTRPDTLYGATYMVVAPEHPLVARLTTPAQAAAVTAYSEQAARKSDLDRTDLAKEKTGVFTGSMAANPVNNRPIPIWVADYVLASYGTGAIMAVPAHDTRDAEFARQFGLELIPVVDPAVSVDPALRAEVLAGNAVFTDEGTAIHSGPYDGQSTAEMQKNIVADLAKRGQGRQAINYKLRDWLFSRQHFWGEPFPILHELDAAGQLNGLVRTVPPEKLPVDLPELKIFDSHGSPDPPLEQAPEDWLWVTIDGRRYKRETNTMPQWAGSCWYFLRFLDPKNDRAFVDPEVERAWMPVDLYIGGAEHAVLHLLYARFWHKVLFDRGHVTTVEPFRRLINQGMILGEMEITGYQHPDGSWASAELVVVGADGKSVLKSVRRAGQAGPRVGRAGAEAGRSVGAGRRSGGPARQPCPQDVEKPRQRRQSGRRGGGIRCRCLAAVRDVHGPAGSDQALEHGRRQRRAGVLGSRLADDRRRAERHGRVESGRAGRRSHGRARPRAASHHPVGDARHRAHVVQHGHRQDDGVHELLPQVRTASTRGDGKARPAAVALRAAPGRRAVEPARARQDVGL